jgi:hypothetical protein
LKDPDAVINYHTDKLRDKHIIGTFANRPISVKSTFEAVRAVLG